MCAMNVVKDSKSIGNLNSILKNMGKRKNLSVESVRKLSTPNGGKINTWKFIVLKVKSFVTILTIVKCVLMRSLGVNSFMKNLKNVDSKRDAGIDSASIDIMEVKDNRKLGSVKRTTGWVILVNLKQRSN